MLEIHCSGTPYEIGYTHGLEASVQIRGSLTFYKKLFWSTCALDWSGVRGEASKYVDTLETICPRYLEEFRGVAAGAKVEFLDIVALNVRSEITFGLFTKQPSLPIKVDGCTSLAIKSINGASWLAQNWDWQVEQSANLVVCHIAQPGFPEISMVTEAGVIGKIGLNDKGVGVCLNAIRARGVDHTKLPIHLALRTALESRSKEEAIDQLNRSGVAGSAHILVADATGATGLECTSKRILQLPMDKQGIIVHANHLVLQHPEVDEPPWLPDSHKREARLRKLVQGIVVPGGSLSAPELTDLFKDEEGYPGAINRHQVQNCETQTLFNIVMELDKPRATAIFGRPTSPSKRIELVF